MFSFFFQAEDGIRDGTVTGVQTCALPILRRDALRLRQHHPPLHVVFLDAPEQEPDIIPRLPLVQQLAEHLHPRHHHLLVRPKPHHLHFLPHLHLPPLDPSRCHRPPPRHRHHVLHPPPERLLDPP